MYEDARAGVVATDQTLLGSRIVGTYVTARRHELPIRDGVGSAARTLSRAVDTDLASAWWARKESVSALNGEVRVGRTIRFEPRRSMPMRA